MASDKQPTERDALRKELAALRARVRELEQEVGTLPETEACFHKLMEITTDGINICERPLDADGNPGDPRKLIWCNDQFVNMSGRTRGELEGADDLNAFVVSRMTDMERRANRERLSAGKASRGVCSWHRPDGRENYHEWVVVPIRRSGRFFTMGIARDITERVRSEAALHKSREDLELTLDASDVVLWDLDPTTGESVLEREWPRVLGYTAEETGDMAGPWRTLMHPEDRESVMAQVRACRDGLIPVYEAEYRLRAKSGQWRWVRARGKVTERDADGRALRMAGAFVDITDHRAMETELRESEKMEAVGQLAGGIAHDVNNLLTAVLGHASLLKVSHPCGSETHAAAEAIEKAADRVAELTAQLLGFARKGKFQSIPVDVHQALGEVLTLVRPRMDARIRMGTDLTAESATVVGDPDQLRRVFINLALNARDAMPFGGSLTFATEVAQPDAHLFPESSEHAAHEHLIVSVVDTGIGMSRDMMHHIFEPFFTTKSPGEGAGMGLATAYGIVGNHGGFIRVESAVGRGTTFRVFLPLTADQAPAALDAAPVGPQSARILLVDDEQVVREAAGAMLRGLGYDVVTASGGAEAVEVYDALGRRADLVIIDLLMPEVSGETCLEALRELNPDVKVLVSSGFADDERVRRAVALGGLGYIQKPYRMEDLQRHVARALGRPRG